MSGVDIRRARRWFWIMVVVAVLAMGALYAALNAPRGPGAGLAVLASGLVLASSLVQANRIRTAITGPGRSLRQLLADARKEG